MNTTNEPPGAFMPPSIIPEESDNEPAASPVLEYSPPPIDRLPPPLAEYVAKSAEAIGCDPCLVAMPALAACAAAIGDARAIEVKPGWIEYPIVWALTISPSGTLKTPAMKAAMHGLEEAQKKAFEHHRLADARYKAEFADWIKNDKNGAEPQPPPLASYYIGDATLEAVGALLDINPRGLQNRVTTPEGAGGGAHGCRCELTRWVRSRGNFYIKGRSSCLMNFPAGFGAAYNPATTFSAGQ